MRVSLDEFVASDSYQAVLHDVLSRCGLPLHSGPEPAVLGELLRQDLEAAGVGVRELAGVVTTHGAELARYVQLKLGAYLRDREGDSRIVTDDLSPAFLVGHIVEFHLLADRPDELERYVRRLRIPNARRYAARVRTIYELALRTV